MTRGFGILLVALAVVVAVVPRYTECPTGAGALPMVCHWTARAEFAVALPLAALGLMLFLSRRGETRRALASMGLLLGVMSSLLPTVLIGVCAHPDAACNSVMKPMMIFAGILATAASLGALALARDAEEPTA